MTDEVYAKARSISRRRSLALGAGGLVAAGLPGCARPSQQLTIVLDWLINVNHMALFAAQSLGAFSQAGLNVTLISPADPDSPARLVAAGQADLAVSYGDQINMLVDKGLPLARVASLVDRPMNAAVALGDGLIRTLADLKGRRIGVSVGGVEEAMLDVMLRSAGLDPAQVTIVKVNYEMVSALLSRKIDAAIGAFRNAEVLELAARGAKPVVFAPEDHGVPAYDELILVARRDRLSDPRLSRLLHALTQATASLIAKPQPVWDAYRKAHPEQNTPTVAEGWRLTLGWIARDPMRLDSARYETFQRFCLAQGIIGKLAPLNQFAVRVS
jgi:putative hydroxymethylpyrimidine transport system substrate-binding protein